MIIGIPKESSQGETRVAATPNSIKSLKKLGFDVVVESGAGDLSGFSDDAYRDAGASVAAAAEVWKSDIIYKVNAPNDGEISSLKEGAMIVSFPSPVQNPELVEKLAKQKVNVLDMYMVPRL